ncbi:hypothetical protein BT96DRAFT_158025 [Gymnopus androsaceus JB14]|uniref:Uncharacterized protein n=1 Tax=Gymnopus androsaceus JB14 TaxID=1447944 RepID=A0A6A4HBW6_9AGAR|nr:hypothetical protein BT96DRAFT_158025 [Gymnopus androsaceus JB14]
MPWRSTIQKGGWSKDGVAVLFIVQESGAFGQACEKMLIYIFTESALHHCLSCHSDEELLKAVKFIEEYLWLGTRSQQQGQEERQIIFASPSQTDSDIRVCSANGNWIPDQIPPP